MGVAVDLERFGLAVRAVEREHQLAADPLAERLPRDEVLQRGDHLGVPAKVDVRADPFLEGREAHLLQPRDVGLREGAVTKFLERPAAPLRQRRPQDLGCISASRGPRAPPVREEALESDRVKLVRTDTQEIALSARDNATVDAESAVVE